MNEREPAHTLPLGEQWDAQFDVIVLGAGAGGMTAALVAATQGLAVLLIEKSGVLGGTMALSSGTVWIPANPHMESRDGDAERAMRYLDALAADRSNQALLRAFIAKGPDMVRYLESRSEVRFRAYSRMPDYRQDIPGAGSGGRPLEPLPFDGRLLGKDFDRLRPPIPELTIWGGMMLTRSEASLLLRGPRSFDAIALGARLLLRHVADRMSHERGTRLVLGNALAGRLYKSLRDERVDIWYRTAIERLILSGGRVLGVHAMREGKPLRVGARQGVVLAGGGFPASREMRNEYLPAPVAQHTAACPDSTGDTIRLALAAGAVLGKGSAENALWFPSSLARRKDGSIAVYPHIVLDRPKPGLIAVDSTGRRFVNEAVSYHEFTRAMYRSHRNVPTIPAYLICDRRFLRRYGLGMVHPPALSIRRHVSSGYLVSAPTLPELALALGLDPDALVQTVARHNDFARTGRDTDFNKGGTIFERANGDASQQPNPCLGPIEKAPFCAVKVYPTPLGTSLGLAVDADARVLDGEGVPLAGLYACGNDADSIFGGEYPGAGAQIGSAMTFGYIAAQHVARVWAQETGAATAGNRPHREVA